MCADDEREQKVDGNLRMGIKRRTEFMCFKRMSHSRCKQFENLKICTQIHICDTIISSHESVSFKIV